MPETTITLTYCAPFEVTLTYFKESGKYYSEGKYMTNCLQMYQIFAEVKNMLEQGKRPGLVDGFDFPYCLVEVEHHPHNHPALIILSPKGATPRG